MEYIQDNLIEVLCQSPNHCCMHAKLLELCLTPCDAMDCNPPGSSVPGILQARILEWVTIASSRGSSCISYVSCFVASIALEIISSPVPSISVTLSYLFLEHAMIIYILASAQGVSHIRNTCQMSIHFSRHIF